MNDSADKMGGPAFPQARVWNAERAEYEDTQQYPGMTMWDYYAAAALTGLYASLQGPPQTADNDLLADAKFIGRIADAMLTERERRMKS